MRRHAHPLWTDAGRPHGPPLTDELLARFHQRLGLRLPPALVAALQRSNGGRLRRTWLPEICPTPRWRGGLVMHNLGGVGYDEGLDWSPTLLDEWGFPGPSLVLCHGGPWAVLLDYRRCGPGGSPPVVFCDTDHEVSGRPVEWTVAPSFAALEAALRPLAERTRLALPGDPGLDAVLATLRAIGAEDPVHTDYEGGRTLALVGPDSAEPGPARLRALPNRRPDGTWVAPELADHAWLVETTVAPGPLDDHLDTLEGAFTEAGAPPLLLFRVDDR